MAVSGCGYRGNAPLPPLRAGCSAACFRTFLPHCRPLAQPHLRVLRLRTMDSTAVQGLVSVHMCMDETLPYEQPDAQKHEANCNN